MLTDEQKIGIAKDFVSCHKTNDVTKWVPSGIDTDRAYLYIYGHLADGIVFDHVWKVGDRNHIIINDYDSFNGKKLTFTWDD